MKRFAAVALAFVAVQVILAMSIQEIEAAITRLSPEEREQLSQRLLSGKIIGVQSPNPAELLQPDSAARRSPEEVVERFREFREKLRETSVADIVADRHRGLQS